MTGSTLFDIPITGMLNKRLLAVLIVFVFVAGLAIAGGTIFVVRNVSISFTNQLAYIQNPNYVLTNMRNSISFVQGRHILLGLDRTAIIDAIEAVEPRVRVTNIEARFPNEVVISVRERYPVFDLRLENGQRLILDSRLRFVTDHNINPILLIKINEQFTMTDPDMRLEIGQDLDYLFNQDTYNCRLNLLKIERLRDMADFFWTRTIFEDGLTHLIHSIEFGLGFGGRLDMNLVMRNRVAPAAAPIQNINIQGVEDFGDFARLILYVWHVYELEDGHNFPGEFRVFINNGQLNIVTPIPPRGLT